VGDLITILADPLSSSRGSKSRIWLRPAEPVLINDDIYMAVFFDHVDEEYVPMIMARSKKGEACLPVPSASYQKLFIKTGLIIRPVALEADLIGMASRMMVDIFQAEKIEFRQAIA